MKIYLAGKIAQNDWRHEVVPGLRGSGDLVDPGEPVPPWSSLPTVIDGVDCVGPFFATSCDHGCMHGPGTHGQGRDGRYEGDAYRSLTRSQVHQRCLDPDRKIAFEMDGKTYHGTDKAFVGDRRRDLNLELAGWRVHRFDGDLIRHDPANAVRIAATLAGGPV